MAPDSARDDAMLLRILNGLLASDVATLHDAMQRASDDLAAVFRADKVDIFLHDPADLLVAVGLSATPMGEQLRALGLDRLPVGGVGRVQEAFRTGAGHVSGDARADPLEAPVVWRELGVRSVLVAPLDIGGRRAVLEVCSVERHAYTEGDLRFAESVATWVGLVATRLLHAEWLAAEAAGEGLRLAAEEAVAVLTARQREVAVLVAEGLTNAEIARRLVLTSGTVANHLEHILRRLEVRGRTQVAMWAVQHGLYRVGEDDDAD